MLPTPQTPPAASATSPGGHAPSLKRGSPSTTASAGFRKPDDAQRTPAFVEHFGTGAGYWNAMRIYPELRLALVAMTNTTYAWDADRLFTLLKDLPWN
jgi:hypothetical protein